MSRRYEEWQRELEVEQAINDRFRHERHPEASVDGEDLWDPFADFEEGDCE